MTTNCIAYKGGYKYQTKASYRLLIDIKPTNPIHLEYVQLESDGTLTIANG